MSFQILSHIGIRNETFDDSRSNTTLTTSSSSHSGDTRFLEQEGATIPISAGIMNGSRVISGASEIMGLLRTLGEFYRLSFMYMCHVLHDYS
jgi:anaphase-promoting complex subunit 3